MILQALTEHYETLAAQGKVDMLGWGKAKISYALCIRDDGGLERVMGVSLGRTMTAEGWRYFYLN